MTPMALTRYRTADSAVQAPRKEKNGCFLQPKPSNRSVSQLYKYQVGYSTISAMSTAGAEDVGVDENHASRSTPAFQIRVRFSPEGHGTHVRGSPESTSHKPKARGRLGCCLWGPCASCSVAVRLMSNKHHPAASRPSHPTAHRHSSPPTTLKPCKSRRCARAARRRQAGPFRVCGSHRGR
jgi:hypothetical protein